MSGIGRGGTGTLRVDGKRLATQAMEHTMPLIPPIDEAFDIGAGTGTPVDDHDYQVPFAFAGKIDKLTITRDPPKLTPEDERKRSHIARWRTRNQLSFDDCHFGFCVGGMEIFDQVIHVKGLGQESNRSSLESSRARLLFHRGCYENHRRSVAPRYQKALQLNPAQTRHLHVGDQARGVIDLIRLQKLLRRRKRHRAVAEGSQKRFRRLTHKTVIIHNRNHLERPWNRAIPKQPEYDLQLIGSTERAYEVGTKKDRSTDT